MDLALMGLQSTLGEVGSLTNVAFVVLLTQVELIMESQVALDHEFLATGLTLELLDPSVGLEMTVQLLGRAKGYVALDAQVITLMDLPPVGVS